MAKYENLEKRFSEKTRVLEERINTDNLNDKKRETLEKQIYVLDKRRLGPDICEFCYKGFNIGCEKDRQEKDPYIRENQTFECKVCDFKHNNKEDLEKHVITCEMYACSLCNYRHKRLSEMKTHCKNKHSKNTIIRHRKMDRDNFSKLSCNNYFSEEV